MPEDRDLAIDTMRTPKSSDMLHARRACARPNTSSTHTTTRRRERMDSVRLDSHLDWTMICSNRNRRRKRWTRSVPIGKFPNRSPRRKTTDRAAGALAMTTTGNDHPRQRKSSSDTIFRDSSSSKSSASYSAASAGDAQKRFSNAKGISSDQFFNRDSDVRM